VHESWPPRSRLHTDLEVILFCLFTQLVNLLFRNIELQEGMINVLGEVYNSGVGNIELLGGFGNPLCGYVNDIGPLLSRKSSVYFFIVSRRSCY